MPNFIFMITALGELAAGTTKAFIQPSSLRSSNTLIKLPATSFPGNQVDEANMTTQTTMKTYSRKRRIHAVSHTNPSSKTMVLQSESKDAPSNRKVYRVIS